MITKQTIIDELSYLFGDKLDHFLGGPISSCSDETIQTKFKDYTNNHLQKIKIKDLIDNYKDTSFLINTPDNLQEVGDFYIKGKRDLLEIKTADNFKTKCSVDHKFESSKGWKFAKDLKKSDLLLTKKGYREIKTIVNYSPEKVYDFEILHENHRYWSGNGISSHNTGKTYLALSIARNAIAMGYSIIYYDSEGGIDIDFVKRLGVDTKKVRIENISTIEEFATKTAKLNETLFELKEKGLEPPKVMVILDSLGNLSSTKEKTDTTSGSGKRDMTKQQAIRRTFRVVGNDFAKNAVPFIICNHVYACLSGDNKVLMDNNSLKEIKDIKKGEYVITLDGSKEVLEIFKYDNIKNYLEFIFEDGSIIKCTSEHKFLVERNEKTEWIKAENLKANDEIIIV